MAIATGADETLHAQLAQSLRELILDARIPAGAKLPSSRMLALMRVSLVLRVTLAARGLAFFLAGVAMDRLLSAGAGWKGRLLAGSPGRC